MNTRDTNINIGDIALVENLHKFFMQMDEQDPGEGWNFKAFTMEKTLTAMKYREEKPQVIKSGVVCCGTCGHRVKDGYTYCNHCGQKQGKLEKQGGGAT